MRLRHAFEWTALVGGGLLLAGWAAARTSFELSRAAEVEALREEFAGTASSAPRASDPRQPVAPDSVAYSDRRSDWSEHRLARFHAGARGRPLALLRIPSLGLEVPVYGKLTEFNLNRGAAVIEGSAPPSSLVGRAQARASTANLGIAAHRDGYFRGLKDLAVGDVVELHNHGGSSGYRIVSLAVVSPEETQVLAPGDRPSVTLVTCYPFHTLGTAPLRYIVRAELADGPEGRADASPAARVTDSIASSDKRYQR